MILYRYCDAEAGLRLLRRGRLYFTPPKYFNDAQELTPAPSTEVTDREYLSYFCSDRWLRPLYDQWTAAGSLTMPYDQFVTQAPSDGRTRAAVAAKIRHANEAICREFNVIMSRHVGVCSMSLVPTSNLMWAHYAASHAGVCIGVEFRASNIVLIDNRQVVYRADKVRLPACFAALPENERAAYYDQVSFTKGQEWEYEREHRLLADLHNKTCHEERRRAKTYYYQDIDMRDITTVILGARCTAERAVRHTLDVRGMAHTTVGKCTQAEGSFSLRVTT